MSAGQQPLRNRPLSILSSSERRLGACGPVHIRLSGSKIKFDINKHM